jgi:hypothetical protein
MLGNIQSSGDSYECQQAELEGVLQLLEDIQAQSSSQQHVSNYKSRIDQVGHRRNEYAEDAIYNRAGATETYRSQRRLDASVEEVFLGVQGQSENAAGKAKRELWSNSQLKPGEVIIPLQEADNIHQEGPMKMERIQHLLNCLASTAGEARVDCLSENIKCVSQLAELLNPVTNCIGAEFGRLFKSMPSNCDQRALTQLSPLSQITTKGSCGDLDQTSVPDSNHFPALFSHLGVQDRLAETAGAKFAQSVGTLFRKPPPPRPARSTICAAVHESSTLPVQPSEEQPGPISNEVLDTQNFVGSQPPRGRSSCNANKTKTSSEHTQSAPQIRLFHPGSTTKTAPPLVKRTRSSSIPTKKDILSTSGGPPVRQTCQEAACRQPPPIMPPLAVKSAIPRSNILAPATSHLSSDAISSPTPTMSLRNSTFLASRGTDEAPILSPKDTLILPLSSERIGCPPTGQTSLDVQPRKPSTVEHFTIAEQQGREDFTALSVKARIRMLMAASS